MEEGLVVLEKGICEICFKIVDSGWINDVNCME